MRTISVRNPRNGQYDYEIQPPSATDLSLLALKMRSKSAAWAALPVTKRCAILQQWKAVLLEQREAILSALVTDTGRYVISVVEFDLLVRAIDRWSHLAPQLLAPELDRQSVALQTVSYAYQYVPYPLVGVISPWNFPLTLSTVDAIPALAAGCVVIVKPSEIAPRFIEPLNATIQAVPELAEVFAFIAGDGETGANLIQTVDAVCFTGSVKTGRTVAESCAAHFIPAFLELGGKDPVIVTETADVKTAAATVLRASVVATGQACQSVERVYVHESIAPYFVLELIKQAEAVRLNYPDIHQGYIGPLIFARQADIIAAQLADAVNKGARVLTGGQIETHGGGLWMRPTVLDRVNHSMLVMQEETFGPVIPVMTYQTIDEAVNLANDSQYGLSANVIAGTLAEAESIALRLDAGAISLNDAALTGLMSDAEKHSFKLSGLGGSRMGPASLMRFCRKKALLKQASVPFKLELLAEETAK